MVVILTSHRMVKNWCKTRVKLVEYVSLRAQKYPSFTRVLPEENTCFHVFFVCRVITDAYRSNHKQLSILARETVFIAVLMINPNLNPVLGHLIDIRKTAR